MKNEIKKIVDQTLLSQGRKDELTESLFTLFDTTSQSKDLQVKLNDICMLAKAFIDEVDKKHPLISMPEDEALYLARHKLSDKLKEQYKN